MQITLGLLALVLTGAEGPSPPDPSPLTYQFTVVEMNGVGWRESVHAQLKPVARQGNVTLWTADRDTLATVLKHGHNVVMAPRVTVFPETPAHVTTRSAERVANPPAVDGEVIRTGLVTTLSGRKLDQGVLTKLVLEDTEIIALHPVSESSGPCGDPADLDRESAQPRLQVPEVARSAVAGEWLIPTDGALLLSLGVRTVADADGKAVVRERLVALAARPLAGLVSGSSSLEPIMRRMPVPVAPGRSMPLALDAAGTPVELPPLPDELVAPTSMPDSSEPCATPQARSIRVPRPETRDRDEQSQPASHSTEGPPPATPSKVIHVPLNGDMMIEFRFIPFVRNARTEARVR